MGAETFKTYYLLALVKPYQQKVILYVTLHEAFVFARERMGRVFRRYWFAFFKQLGKIPQCVNFLGLVFVSFEVFTKLCAIPNLLHDRE